MSEASVTDACRRGLHGDCDDWFDTYCACDCHEERRRAAESAPRAEEGS